MARLPLSLFAAALVACGAPDPPGSTGGTDVAPGPCGRGFVVVHTDYQSTNVSLVGYDGTVLSESFISSASSKTALSSALTGDVVVPTQPLLDGTTVLIDRNPASVLTWVDTVTGEPLRQLNVLTGFTSNPHDYAQVSPRKAYVTRYEHNADAGREPFDQGSDVLVIDPSVPEIVGRIDLLFAMEDAPGFFPRADRIAVVGDRAYVLLASYAVPVPAGATDSRIVVIDTTTDTPVGVHVLEGLRGCASMAVSPDQRSITVTCLGPWPEDGRAQPGSGVAVLDIGDELTEVRRLLAADVSEGIVGLDSTYADEDSVSILTIGFPGEIPDTVERIDIDSGSVERVLSAGAFELTGIRCACDTCYAADAAQGVVHRFDVDGDGRLQNRREIVIETDIGLPPRYVGRF